jgi:hypothetical protein
MARAMDVLLASKENPNLMADARETWRGLPNAIIPPFFRMEGLLQLGDMEGAVAELRSMRDRRDPMFAWSGWALALVEPSPDLAPYLAILEESGIPPALP